MKKALPAAAALAAATLAITGCAPGPSTTETTGSFPESGEVVTLVVPFDAGGITDVFARLFAPELESALGTSVVIENRPGAGGQVGITSMLAAPADGYTIGFTNLPSTLAYLDPARGATYDESSFSLLGGIGLSPTAIAVSSSGPYETLDDLIAAAEAAPGEITLATGGSGASDDFLASVELEETAGIDLNLVTFEGGSADKVTALLGGDIDAVMGSVGGVLAQVASGDMRLIGTATPERSTLTEDVPTFTEAGYDVTISGTLNIAAPAGVPDDVAAALSAAIEEATSSPEFIEASAVAGFEVAFTTPEDFAADWAAQQDLIAPLFE
ncbi:tripartite tricarboxylate transporter substrate binding protein [Agrococcus sp. ARC_14]|uniref:tripartite tricarboxylate transporter substrate binding protein n=1 Tax=Agrococcus sp. ARC_14 TaxID=2919927 RepID=UPI001F052206|nr:tripartite tricarboxylate transporter substrate binding protein [Agrococcus sp. ARC_14]MCH1881909.1 tripartite tricarboxylate transporter substrate binding protein [Agrococcus sp. ARC_14]